MELISIIVPIYNVELYLKQCIESIIGQTYKNLEIILVDDGSPDRCGEICDEYEKEDERIKVIHKKNGGLSSARNAGLDIANGEYIAFIDSDDFVANNFIENLYNLCREKNADIAECTYVNFTDKPIIKNHDINIEVYTPENIRDGLSSYSVVKSICVWNKLYKRYIYEDLRFPLGKINEDAYVTYKAFYKNRANTVISNQPFYFYRYNEQSIMGRKFNIKRLDVLGALEEQKEFFLSHNEDKLYDISIKEYLQQLKTCYFLVKKHIVNPEKYLSDILKKARINYKEAIARGIKIDVFMLKITLFVLFPNFYCFLMKTLKKC